tara:strand:+ start:302 stop:514 length:213 start_codon:yes stop_codon:yes gene_type:complete
MTKDQEQKIKQFLKKLPRTLTQEEILQVVQDTVEYGIDNTYEDAWSFPKIPSHTSWRKYLIYRGRSERTN